MEEKPASQLPVPNFEYITASRFDDYNFVDVEGYFVEQKEILELELIYLLITKTNIVLMKIHIHE